MTQLKEIDGRYYQECEAIMLPTENIIENGNQLHLYIRGYLVIPRTSGEAKRIRDYQNYKPQHLYITSNEEIKKGDWFYNEFSKIIGKAEFNFGKDELAKKIIASTDESLGLPKPSNSFIQRYIKEYNKGNIITDVLVEYNNFKIVDFNKQGVKINSNNTINIKVKDSYSREEVIKLLSKLYDDITLYGGLSSLTPKTEDLTNWINQNL